MLKKPLLVLLEKIHQKIAGAQNALIKPQMNGPPLHHPDYKELCEELALRFSKLFSFK